LFVSRHPLIAATLVLVALVAWLTWPQCRHLTDEFAWHNDPHFSTWRLAWIAHALQTNPRHLFDGNIFYPAERTLAYSDATFLQGALAAPFFWAGVPPVAIYNVMLLAGFVGSGVAMFVLAHRISGSAAAALIAAAIFSMVPYRIEHFAHIEQQWAMWVPLAFWAVHRTVDEASWRHGALAGVFLWLQVLSCVYYGIFLAIAMTALAIVLILVRRQKSAIAIAWLAVGAGVAFALTLPYARPYLENLRLLGSRSVDEVAAFSARPVNYLATPSQNWVWGWTSDRFGASELRLFPGAIATVLAALAFVKAPRKMAWAYLVVCIVAVELSLGINGHLYRWLLPYVHALNALRSPSRAAIIAFGALAVLASIGFAGLEAQLRTRGLRTAVLASVIALLAIEYGSAPLSLTEVSDKPSSLDRALRGIGPGVMIELPVPALDRLPGHDAIYERWSINHWHPLVNGYSGYYPAHYFVTMDRMRRFPDALSMARLEALSVRYIVVHRAFFDREDYETLIRRMIATPRLTVKGRFYDPAGEADLFELSP
jgi:hypothetical protein